MVRAEQAPSGAFRSHVHLSEGVRSDENAFATALVLDEVDRLDFWATALGIRSRALDFLERCADPDVPGAFRFYPSDSEPEWLPVPLRPDADDTALVTALLVRHGRLSPAAARSTLRRTLAPHRLHAAELARRPWHLEGLYLTWLDPDLWPNVVDLCVNLNVARLIVSTGMDGRDEIGVSPIFEAARLGLAWAADSPDRARLLCPFYPDPRELRHALARVVSEGGRVFGPLAREVAGRRWARSSPRDEAPICSALDGVIRWSCPLLQRVRGIRSIG